jgi:hypothetical protein
MDAEVAAIQPNGSAAHVPATEPMAIAQHPATVTVAATGIVAMLSATAHPLAEPMCIRAIGVLTDHATVDAITAPVSPCVARRSASVPRNRSTIASMRGLQRDSTRGVSVNRAATVP